MKTKLSKLSNYAVLPAIGGNYEVIHEGKNLGLASCPMCFGFHLVRKSDDIWHYECENCNSFIREEDLEVGL